MLEIENAPRFWRFYFGASVALIPISSFTGKLSASGVVGLALGVIGLCPLYGYVWQRRVNPRLLWKVLFILQAIVLSVAVLIGSFVALSHLALLPLAWLLATTTSSAPYFLALYRYVYRSPHLWSSLNGSEPIGGAQRVVP